jgi:PAS domain S-box-containing protein
MAETPLEEIRRLIREAEEEQRRTATAGPETEPAPAASTSRMADDPAFARSRPRATPSAGQLDPSRGTSRNTDILLESARQSFIMVDADGGWELANCHLPQWLGYARDEFENINLTDIFEAQDVRRLLGSLPRWLGGEEPLVQVPFDLIGKKGERIPVLLSSYAWVNEAGAPAAYLILEDMRPLRSLEAQIAATKAFVDAVMRSGAVPTILMRADGVILDANKAAGKWLGTEAEELLNTSLQEYVSAVSRTESDTLLSRALQLLPSGDVYCRFRRANGAEFGGRLSMVGVSDAKGNINRVLGTIIRAEAEAHGDAASPDSWAAYGQMTPGFLNELSSYVGTSMRDASELVRPHDNLPAGEPVLAKLLQSLDRTRSMLRSWVESAEFLGDAGRMRRFGDLIRDALAARRPELERWDIETRIQEGETGAEAVLCPFALFPAVLHILQSCVEELRESPGNRRLTIQVMGTGERWETSFLYDVSGPQPLVSVSQGEPSIRECRSTNLELRAAQKLLDRLGGTLVLENLSGTQRAIRMNLNVAALSAGPQNPRMEREGEAS